MLTCEICCLNLTIFHYLLGLASLASLPLSILSSFTRLGWQTRRTDGDVPSASLFNDFLTFKLNSTFDLLKSKYFFKKD